MAIGQKFFVFMGCAVLVLFTSHLCYCDELTTSYTTDEVDSSTNFTTESGGGGGRPHIPTLPVPIEDIFQVILRRLLQPIDPLYFPLIPTMAIPTGGGKVMSLSMTNVTFSGLSSTLDVINMDIPGVLPTNKNFNFDINFGEILLYAGEYSAGGYLGNIPFTGESYMKVSLQDAHLGVGMKMRRTSLFCIKEGSTSYRLDIRKPVVYFDNLNPGTDQGLLLNTVLSGIIPDVIDYFEFLFNDKLHDQIDGIVVSGLNNVTCNRDSYEDMLYY